MAIFHECEQEQFLVLLAYHAKHGDARYDISFKNGERYICSWFVSYESGNWDEVDAVPHAEPRESEYDEYNEIAMTIDYIIQNGSRRYDDKLTLNYRDFPLLITNADTGETIYPMEIRGTGTKAGTEISH